MYRKLAYLIVICFSLSILGLAFHHHADGVPHENCSICSYVSHHPNLVIQDAPQFSLLFSNVLFISIENPLNVPSLNYHPYSNRAPPES